MNNKSIFPQCSSGSSKSGQSLVEMAIVLPVFLVVLLGILEFGWLFHNEMILANAVRECTRAAAVGRMQTEVRTRIDSSASPIVVSVLTLEYSSNNGTTWLPWPADDSGKNGVPPGMLIRISAQGIHQQLTNFFPFLQGFSLKQFAVMKREA
jgi:hypothetical protein